MSHGVCIVRSSMHEETKLCLLLSTLSVNYRRNKQRAQLLLTSSSSQRNHIRSVSHSHGRDCPRCKHDTSVHRSSTTLCLWES